MPCCDGVYIQLSPFFMDRCEVSSSESETRKWFLPSAQGICFCILYPWICWYRILIFCWLHRSWSKMLDTEDVSAGHPISLDVSGAFYYLNISLWWSFCIFCAWCWIANHVVFNFRTFIECLISSSLHETWCCYRQCVDFPLYKAYFLFIVESFMINSTMRSLKR